MTDYIKMIAELKEQKIKAFDDADFYDYIELPLEEEFETFFQFGQEYINRTDLGFDARPAYLFFNTKTTTNVLARKAGKNYLIEIFKGSLFELYELFTSKKGIFRKRLCRVTLRWLLSRELHQKFICTSLQRCILCIMKPVTWFNSMEASNYIEFMAHVCVGEDVKIRHMRELDADMHAGHALAMHIRQSCERNENNDEVNAADVSNAASLALAAVYTFFVNAQGHKQPFYLESKCHPHPVVRLCYMVKFILDNLQANVPFQLEQEELLKNAILTSEQLLKDGETNVVEEYSLMLGDHLNEIEEYIEHIPANAESYKWLGMHLYKAQNDGQRKN